MSVCTLLNYMYSSVPLITIQPIDQSRDSTPGGANFSHVGRWKIRGSAIVFVILSFNLKVL